MKKRKRRETEKKEVPNTTSHSLNGQEYEGKHFSKHLKQRIESIKGISITGVDDEWIGTNFRHSKKLIYNEYFDSQRYLAINDQGLLDIAYLPQVIPKNICDQVELVLDEELFNSSIAITGTWNRYRNELRESMSCTKKEKTLIEQLNEYCQDFVWELLEKLNMNMANKLKSIDDNLRRFANYPTLALNKLCADDYNKNEKPYYFHFDENDLGMSTLLYFGNFCGGELVVKPTNVAFKIKRGDVVFLNTKKHMHAVTKVTKGTRYGMIYFAGSDHFKLIGKNGETIPPLKLDTPDVKLRERRSEVKVKICKNRNQYLNIYK